MRTRSDYSYDTPRNNTKPLNKTVSVSSGYSTQCPGIFAMSNNYPSQGFEASTQATSNDYWNHSCKGSGDNHFVGITNAPQVFDGLISMSPEPMSKSHQTDPSLVRYIFSYLGHRFILKLHRRRFTSHLPRLQLHLRLGYERKMSSYFDFRVMSSNLIRGSL